MVRRAHPAHSRSVSDSDAFQSNGTRDAPPPCDGFGEQKRVWRSDALTGCQAHEARAFLALAAMRGVGQKTLLEIAESGQRYSQVFEQGPALASGRLLRMAPRDRAAMGASWPDHRDQALERAGEMQNLLDRQKVSLILRGDPRFPLPLLDLARPPQWLFIQGSVDRLSEAAVAIVGTRKPSVDGLFLASYVGACLGDWAAPTVSGLAIGIDQSAHEHSLRAGIPTIAVLGTGILEDYPRGSEMLRERILATGGSIVTEYLPHTTYSAENFVQRNRLQAALGRVLVPVEWSRRSGTAHTVRFAAELKRPIACLRLPDWRPDRVVLEPGLGEGTGAIFTVPREQGEFNRFIRHALSKTHVGASEQLSLFGGDGAC
jgi:DNA processing protein